VLVIFNSAFYFLWAVANIIKLDFSLSSGLVISSIHFVIKKTRVKFLTFLLATIYAILRIGLPIFSEVFRHYLRLKLPET